MGLYGGGWRFIHKDIFFYFIISEIKNFKMLFGFSGVVYPKIVRIIVQAYPDNRNMLIKSN